MNTTDNDFAPSLEHQSGQLRPRSTGAALSNPRRRRGGWLWPDNPGWTLTDDLVTAVVFWWIAIDVGLAYLAALVTP